MLARIVEVDGISIASGFHLVLLTDLPPGVIEASASDVEALEGMWERAIEKYTRPNRPESRVDIAAFKRALCPTTSMGYRCRPCPPRTPSSTS